MPRPSVVFVSNKSAHDFSDAKRFGELVYLTEGPANRFAVIDLHRQIEFAMRAASRDDYVLITGLSIINVIACSLMAVRFGRLNLLIFDIKTKKYVTRTLVLEKPDDRRDD